MLVHVLEIVKASDSDAPVSTDTRSIEAEDNFIFVVRAVEDLLL